MSNESAKSAARPSKVEELKEQSRFLRGTIAESVAAGGTHFDDGDAQLLKLHGIYQEYDRDTMAERRAAGVEKDFQLMVRARLPGGRLTADQYLALDAIAGRYANGGLRVTSRQSIQFHGVLKRDIGRHIAEMNAALVTTLGACGDVVRNVVTAPAPIADAVHARLESDARMLSEAFLPRGGAYHEIWLDGEKLEGEGNAAELEPLYGRTYLPRKFKIGIATPDDNSIDVLGNDLAILALWEGGALRGYDFFLGGGMGMTHNKPETYPRLATPVAFVAEDELLAATEAVIKLLRDEGDRSNRKHARLKYLIEERGAAWARERMEAYLGHPLADPLPVAELRVVDHLGWHAQGDGRWYLGVPVPSGRIADTAGVRLRTALREVVERWRPRPILTPGQDVLLADVRPEDREGIEAAMRGHGVRLAEELPPVERWALACPAMPTCGLALAESERISGPLLEQIAAALARHGLSREAITVRITGCPNGCVRPYSGELGIVGRAPGQYAIFAGGSFNGTRLAKRLLDKVELERIADALEPLFALFAAERRDGERFGEFCARSDFAQLAALAEGALAARCG